MPQHGQSQGSHIVSRGGVTTVQDGPRLGSENQILSGSRAGSPCQPVPHKLRRAIFFRASGTGDVDGIIDHVLADRYLPDELLNSQHVATAQHWMHIRVQSLRGGLHDRSFFIA